MNKGPWGSNGGSNNPWNNGNLENDDNVKEFKPKKKGDGMPPIHFSLGIKVAIAIVFGLWLLTGFYEVHPEEQGVVLRFGKYVGTTGPGLNYHLPYPIENVLLPNITRENRIAIGLRADASHYEYSKKNYRDIQSRPDEAVMLTGDENIVELEYTITWKIKDSKQFLFKVKDPEITVKKAAESAMREVIGQTPIVNALTDGKRDIQNHTRTILQKLLDDYQAGISITSVQLLRVDPPTQVIDAFVDVQRAKADKERLKNEAEAYSNDIIPRARGEAKQTIINAEAYKEQVINLAKGEASRFSSVYQEYKLAKEVTMKRMYLEAMEEVMSENNKVLLDDKAGSVLPYLPLNSINKQAK
ncbi:MAG: Modulator of FtsH protease HflK [Alphaproteobacteria bacterium ADurb.Bin438]|nr:MAG: Modulator of FtsH protease HflK [Alphaproteobacteria bacterium ADurb.Bin438]